VWFDRANILVEQKDYRNAIASYTKAIELENDFAEAFFNRGLTYIYLGENKQGIADLSKAGELGLYIAYNIIKRFGEKN
jgi:tetratricopeptide (TPR) repeat protein